MKMASIMRYLRAIELRDREDVLAIRAAALAVNGEVIFARPCVFPW
jgi:hypothetical protein